MAAGFCGRRSCRFLCCGVLWSSWLLGVCGRLFLFVCLLLVFCFLFFWEGSGACDRLFLFVCLFFCCFFFLLFFLGGGGGGVVIVIFCVCEFS